MFSFLYIKKNKKQKQKSKQIMSDTNDDGFEKKLSLSKLEWRPSVGGGGGGARVPEGWGSNLRNTHPGCTEDTGAGFGPAGYTKNNN